MSQNVAKLKTTVELEQKIIPKLLHPQGDHWDLDKLHQKQTLERLNSGFMEIHSADLGLKRHAFTDKLFELKHLSRRG